MSALEFFKNPPVVWFLIGLFFALLELAVPGLVLIFFGFGAWIVALLCLLLDLSLSLQIFIFAAASVISLIFLRKGFKKRFLQEKPVTFAPGDNELVGKIAKVEIPIEAGKPGKVMFHGALWIAESESNIAAGQQVEIIEAKSITLIVKPIKS